VLIYVFVCWGGEYLATDFTDLHGFFLGCGGEGAVTRIGGGILRI